MLVAVVVQCIGWYIEHEPRERDLAAAGTLMEALENQCQKSCDALGAW